MTEILDIEQEAVSSVIDVDRLSAMYQQGVRPVHFFDPVNAAAIEWSLSYWAKSAFKDSPTAKSLQAEFPSIELIKPSESIMWLCDELKKRYMSSNIQKIMLDVSGDVVDKPLEVVKKLQEETWRIASNVEDRIHVSELKDSIEGRKARFQQRKRAAEEGGIYGMPIGLDQVDKYTNGLQDGELAVIAGFAKSGKTWMGLNVAKVTALSKKRTLFITLELSIDDIEDRMDALLSGVSFSRLSTGLLSRKEQSTLSDAYEAYSEFGDVIIEQPNIGDRTVPYICRRARDLDVDMLVIDQLSFMEASKNFNDEYRRLALIVSDLKREISRTDAKTIPCVLLAQMNRASKSSRHGRGDLSTLAGTSELERGSDIVYGVSQTKQEAINSSMTFEILGSRRTALKAWVVRRQLNDCTEIKVLREREDDGED